jgi:excisionase family DNA binding protein
MSQIPEIFRDERGRPCAADGWPISGLATVQEVASVSGLAPSTIYQMIASGELESRRFGRSLRVPWSLVRSMFLDEPQQLDEPQLIGDVTAEILKRLGIVRRDSSNE